jgi:hypothetical protein
MIKGQLQQLLSHREKDITAIVTDREKTTIMDGWIDVKDKIVRIDATVSYCHKYK